jgi:hypothetical protein
MLTTSGKRIQDTHVNPYITTVTIGGGGIFTPRSIFSRMRQNHLEFYEMVLRLFLGMPGLQNDAKSFKKSVRVFSVWTPFSCISDIILQLLPVELPPF